MNYKDFAEFLNHSREATDLLGTSSRLRDRLQTNVGYRGPGDKRRIGNEGKEFVWHLSFFNYLDRFQTHILLVCLILSAEN